MSFDKNQPNPGNGKVESSGFSPYELFSILSEDPVFGSEQKTDPVVPENPILDDAPVVPGQG
jgi:hypothetical protein